VNPVARGRTTLAAAIAAAALAFASPLAAAPGDKQYTIITIHSPQAFIKALRAGADFAGGKGRRFRIVLASAGVIVAIPGVAISQLEYMKTRRPAGLEIIACKETVDALSKANKRRMPTLPGIKVQTCASMRNKMTVDGWQTAPGL
jgi:hypothetical protein